MERKVLVLLLSCRNDEKQYLVIIFYVRAGLRNCARKYDQRLSGQVFAEHEQYITDLYLSIPVRLFSA